MAQIISVKSKSFAVCEILTRLHRKLKTESFPNGNSGVIDSEARAVAEVLPRFGISIRQRVGDAYTCGWYGWHFDSYLTSAQMAALKKFVDEYEYDCRTFKITSI